MKATYKGFEAKENITSFIQLPPAGVYEAQILDVRVVDADGEKTFRDTIEVMVEITEGECKGRFTAVYTDMKERLGSERNVQFKGVFKLVPPIDGDEDWRVRAFEGNIWCVEESNPGFHFVKADGTWDDQGLRGKKIGLNIRNRLYTYTGSDGETHDGSTIEIARFERIEDVKSGKAKPMKDRDTRKKEEVNASTYTDVTGTAGTPFNW